MASGRGIRWRLQLRRVMIVSKMVRDTLRGPVRKVRRRILPWIMPPASEPCTAGPRDVRVVGLLSSASGIGKSARLCMDTLQRSGFTVTGNDLAGLLGSSDGIVFPASNTKRSTRELSIFHLNPPMLLPGILFSGPGRYYAGYNIGYWAWELEVLPHEWIQAIRYLRAIIVPSFFCRATMKRYTSKPVLVVPHPVHATGVPSAKLGEDVFRVLNIFRFGSSFERKNPLALIRAFRSAFDDDPNAQLVLKTSDGEQYPAEKAKLLREAGGASNIEIIDSVWSNNRVEALLQSADVYASLHRSEGFGLPLAEAIMHHVPIVATNWSGNTDFCSPQHTFAVDYKLIDFHDPHPDYEQVQHASWADASVTHAALQLQRVRADPTAARNRAIAARHALCHHLLSFTYERALATLSIGREGDARTGPSRLDRAR
jgi:glycosyltransferase involved in cell wall biosynthesis